MVCPRCVSVLRLEANQLGLPLTSVQLGEVVFENDLSKPQFDAFINALASHGFEVLDDRKAVMIEKVKNIIVNIVHGSDTIDIKRNLSDIISREIGIERYFTYIVTKTVKEETVQPLSELLPGQA